MPRACVSLSIRHDLKNLDLCKQKITIGGLDSISICTNSFSKLAGGLVQAMDFFL